MLKVLVLPYFYDFQLLKYTVTRNLCTVIELSALLFYLTLLAPPKQHLYYEIGRSHRSLIPLFYNSLTVALM